MCLIYSTSETFATMGFVFLAMLVHKRLPWSFLHFEQRRNCKLASLAFGIVVASWWAACSVIELILVRWVFPCAFVIICMWISPFGKATRGPMKRPATDDRKVRTIKPAVKAGLANLKKGHVKGTRLRQAFQQFKDALPFKNMSSVLSAMCRWPAISGIKPEILLKAQPSSAGRFLFVDSDVGVDEVLDSLTYYCGFRRELEEMRLLRLTSPQKKKRAML